MEETPLEKVIHALVFMGICAAIIFIGWREPLKYRFMSAEKIAEVERAIVGSVEPLRGTTEWNAVNHPSQWHPTGTSLDRAPWEKKRNKVTYRPGNMDTRQLGLPTESVKKTGAEGQH